MYNKNLTRRRTIQALGTAGIIGLAGCTDAGDDADDEIEDEADEDAEVRAAFVYHTDLSDIGWARAHENGRQAVEEEFDWVSTAYTDGIPGEDVRPIFETFAGDDYDVIYGTTTEYQDPMMEVAEDYPDIAFEHCNGFLEAENMARYMGKFYEGWYLNGVAAGLLTESNTLGMVVPIPIPQILRQLNAFTLGARSVNPDVTTHTRWINDWFDPSSSSEAADNLIDEGADVLGSNMTSGSDLETASEREVFNFGVNTSMAAQGGQYYATAQINNWTPYYLDSVQDVRNDDWETGWTWGGVEEGMVELDEFGPEVPDEVVTEVNEVMDAMADGEVDVWSGSMYEGWSESELFEDVDSYVEGVDGEAP